MNPRTNHGGPRRLKIGIMLRHLGQHGGGVSVYTRNLLKELAILDIPHELLLIYANARFLGQYADGRRIREVVLRAPHALVWDQLLVPRAVERQGVDVLFNPKYSIPLRIKCPAIWVCHGLDWYVQPSWSLWKDRLNHRWLIPRYASKADAVIAVSNVTKNHLVKYLGVDEKRVQTVYHGVDEVFFKPVSPETLHQIRQDYRLPPRFLLYVGQIYPPKNFGRLLQAFARVGPSMGIHLVIAGAHTSLCEQELNMIRELGLDRWVVQTGWINHDHLPAFYALATALVLPSLYESFGMPVLEAMASGCPVLTADRYGTKELAEGAALLVNPENTEAIARGMGDLVSDSELRENLVRAGRQRALAFTWRKCAEETMQTLERFARRD